MSPQRMITVLLHVTIPDSADPESAAASLFDTACEWADDHYINSVVTFSWRHGR